jgi:micrococcal nuclease
MGTLDRVHSTRLEFSEGIGERVKVFGHVFSRIAALSLAAKVLLAVAALVALALSIPLSPFVAIVAFLVLLVAIVALILRVLQRRPLRNWGLTALVSLLFVIVFSGIAYTLYDGGAAQQEPSPGAAEEAEQETPLEEAEQETGVEETDPPEEAELPLERAEQEAGIEEIDPALDEEGNDSGRFEAMASVTRVVDGDTVEISPAIDSIEDLRLKGVDTPESKDPDCGAQPHADEASAFTEAQLESEEVEIEFDIEKKDRYGRLLAYVYPKDGELFNETLLEEGYAQVATIPPNVKYV